MSSLFEFRLPDIGEGVAEGEIVQWKLQAGDAVAEDQPFLEVMTDKATVEISCPVRGTLHELVAKAGDVVPVGAVLCTIEPAAGAHVPTIASHGDGGHAKPAAKAAPAAAKAAPAAESASSKPAMPLEAGKGARSTKASEHPETPKPPEVSEPAPAAKAPLAKAPAARAPVAEAPTAEAPILTEFSRPAGQRALATPYTRRLARELGLDVEKIEGTGEVGRVTEQDVRAFAEARKAMAAAVPAAKPAAVYVAPAPAPSLSEQVAARPAASPSAPVSKSSAPAAGAAGRETRIPIRGLRKRISERMHQSKTTAAHFTYVDDCDVTELVALRGKMKDRAAKRGVKLTYLPFIAKALVSAFQQFPSLNGVTDDAAQEFVVKHYFNFGLAVDAPDGLIVPVVKDVDKRSLLDLASEMDRLASEAREGKSKLEDLRDGTFTITNAGNIGGLFATPIINYPEAAILGVHAIKKTPRVVEGKIEIRDVMYLSISIDHRMNDGATGARFMNHVIGMLQDPQQLMLEM